MYIVRSSKKVKHSANKWPNMNDKDIVLNLALTRGAMMDDKKAIIKKHFSGASGSFMNQTHSIYTILFLAYVCPNVSTLRIYEHANIKSSIILRILVKFKFLMCDKSKPTHKYNVTPLTRLIIADLIAAYKTNLTTFEHLNQIDKKANYLDIKAKIKTLKQK